MFKDTDKALARLEAELLKEEEPAMPVPETEYEESPYDEAAEEDVLPPEFMYTDTRAASGPAVYQNFSNHYGKDLRNYASGYRAYNADIAEGEDYSEELLQDAPEEKSNTPLILIACLLALAVVGMLGVWLFLTRGLL